MTHSFAQDFGPFGDVTWLNCAHQGALPNVAAREAQDAIGWKVNPSHLTSERFEGVPRRMRRALGELVGVSAEEIILANSASYGLHLLANGIKWQAGDEILLAKNDFPSDILPWLALESRGLRVRLIEPRRYVLQPDELAAHITPATRLVCLTLVHAFSGHVIDVDALGTICRENNVIFVLNCSQGIGTRPFDAAVSPIDALTCVGFKWLCGPYGTGFCWIQPDLRETLEYNQAYWLAMQSADDLGTEQEVKLRTDLGARKYDVFGTANFFNFKPWAASVEYLLGYGIDRIQRHNAKLVCRLVEGLDPHYYDLLSPRDEAEQSTLVFLSHKESGRNKFIYQALLQEDICVAFRRGSIRVSPHLYNTPEDIDRLLSALQSNQA